MTATLDEKETLALADIKQFLRQSKKPVIAMSGGKDGVVAAHLVHQVANLPSVCEVSFYYEQQTQDIKDSAARLGWNVAYRDSLSVDWLRRHPELPFSDVPSVRSASFLARQQKTVNKEMTRFDYTGAIFGRRTQENTVRAKHYTAAGRDSFHPIRDWSEDDVWAYFAKHQIPVPWIYSTEHGKREGNSPFYSIHSYAAGGVINAWRISSSIDNQYQPSIMGPQYEKNLRDTADVWYW